MVLKRGKALLGICCVAMVASAAAFSVMPHSLSLRARSNFKTAARPVLAREIRMQQQEAEVKEEEEVQLLEKNIQAMDNNIGVAIRDRSVEESKSVQTEPEVNFYARTAVKLGALKPTSPLLTTNLVGNKGFDPLNFASKPDLLLQMRESELKHSRLAMLASVGWAVSELLHDDLAKLFGSQSLLQPGASGALEKAPSVLNGGLGAVPPYVWAILLLVTGFVESTRMILISENPNNFKPGDLGFDPLGFYRVAGEQEKRSLELKEVNNGRLAMIAIAIFAGQEFVGNEAIVKMFPQFFTSGPLANASSVLDLIFKYTGLLSCESGLVYCGEGQGALGALLKEDNGATAEYLLEVLAD